MKHDPEEMRMRELGWQRNLSEKEQAELRAWLAANPDARTEWETEAELSALLNRLPDVPVPTNFPARVLQAVDRETAGGKWVASSGSAWWWRVFAPRMVGVALVVCLGLFSFQSHQLSQRKQHMAQSLAAVSDVDSLSNPAMLQDFEAIRRLAPAQAPDKELLALMQ